MTSLALFVISLASTIYVLKQIIKIAIAVAEENSKSR